MTSGVYFAGVASGLALFWGSSVIRVLLYTHTVLLYLGFMSEAWIAGDAQGNAVFGVHYIYWCADTKIDLRVWTPVSNRRFVHTQCIHVLTINYNWTWKKENEKEQNPCNASQVYTFEIRNISLRF